MSILDNLTDKVSKTAKAAAKRSGELVEITRLCVNIGIEEDKIEKILIEIGKKVYEAYAKNEDVLEAAKEFCEKIKSFEENIKDMKEKILALKNIKICSQCLAELDIDFEYCSKCGAKQEVIEHEAIKEEAELPKNKKVCSNCGAVNDVGYEFCPKCGTKL